MVASRRSRGVSVSAVNVPVALVWVAAVRADRLALVVSCLAAALHAYQDDGTLTIGGPTRSTCAYRLRA